MSEKKGLSPRQLIAVRSLLDGLPIGEAAQAAGVSERQAYRWLASPDFSAALRSAEGEAMRACGRRLVSMTDAALDALTEVLNRPSSPGASTKRLAARDVLDLAARWYETTTFEDRLAALERQVGNGK